MEDVQITWEWVLIYGFDYLERIYSFMVTWVLERGACTKSQVRTLPIGTFIQVITMKFTAADSKH